MTEKEIANAVEETIETYEFTDDDGQEHCFVVESKFKVGNDDYVALLEVDPSIFAEEEEECSCGCEHDHAETAATGMTMTRRMMRRIQISSLRKWLRMRMGKLIFRFPLMRNLKRRNRFMKIWKHDLLQGAL